MDLREIFLSEQAPYSGTSKRDKFLSRVFGIFNEEIVRIWCSNKNSPFIDLGRPTVYDPGGNRYTLDFLLENEKGEKFVGEMKCEIEYQKYRYFTLGSVKQLEHHRTKRAFQMWLDIASGPDLYTVRCSREDVKVAGSALIWGRVTAEGAESVRETYGISHVISAEAIIADLIAWRDESYLKLVDNHSNWTQQLYSGLKGE
jgi:hypothetical protein